MRNKYREYKIIMLTMLPLVVLILTIVITAMLSFKSIDPAGDYCIKDKERISSKDGSYYLVFTDKEVLKNDDSILRWKFNSSDIYSDLIVGECYSLKTNWFRVPFLSMYRNILKIN